MGDRTIDNAKLYKPTEGEAGYAAKVNDNFERLAKMTNQILAMTKGPINLGSTDFYVVTKGQILADSPGAKWSIGGSAMYDFTSRNGAFVNPPSQDGYIQRVDFSAVGPSDMAQIGGGEPLFLNEMDVLFCIWEMNPLNADVWNVVACAWTSIQNIL